MPKDNKVAANVGDTSKLAVPEPSDRVEELRRKPSISAVQTNREAEWIRKKLKKKVCRRFVEKEVAPPDDPQCHCGYKKSRHLREALTDRDKTLPWRDSVDTKSSPTDAFGEIEFMGFGQKIGKYVRVAQDTEMAQMLKLLIERWDIEKPNLVISVTGGAKNFHLSPRLKDVFRRGLMKAAKSTGAWIITGGMHAGVMKYVGQAVKEFELTHTSKTKVTAIGIATWGCVRNKELLIDRMGKWPAEYRMEARDKSNNNDSPLDNNHSHFILVDNGTQHQFGKEIDFRGRLEGAIAKMKTNSVIDAVQIPIVCVVVEGGPGTLETVKSAVENDTPAVIVEGSGRAADVLAFAYANSHAEEITFTDQYGNIQKRMTTVMDDALIVQIKQKISDDLGKDNIAKCSDWVKQSLQKRDLITVFQLDSPESAKDIDLAILYAMLKANKDQVLDQLRLAIAWNRIDVAKEMIFTEDRKWPQHQLHDIMLSVLILDRHDFAHLFIENGVNLKDFLTLRRLLMLYNEVPKNSLLYGLLSKSRKERDKPISFHQIGALIAELMGDFYSPLYLREKRYKKAKAEEILFDQAAEGNASVASLVGVWKDDQLFDSDFDDPPRELFIWSVLMLRKEMATVFWAEGKDAIPAALTACTLLKSLNHKTQDTEIQKQINKLADHFESLSLGVLNECYQADDNKAQLFLVRELPNYGLATSLLLAVEADNKKFISHACCQSLLNSIWRGKMTMDNGPIRIFLCVFLPILVPMLIYYSEDEKRVDDILRVEESEEPQLKRKETRPTLHQGESFELAESDPNVLVRDDPDPLLSGIDFRDSGKKLTSWQRFILFFSAPMITFIYNCISYIAFLILFSYILLVSFNPVVTPEEIVLIGWVFTLFAEEVRQIVMDDSSTFRLRLRNYISDSWNVLDVITICLFIIGMVLRSLPYTDTFTAARIILALNLMTFYFRLLHIFSVFKQLGPILVMIGRMMVDLLWFIIILMVFLIGFGVAQHAIIYPNAPAEPILILNVIRKAYWQMQGEIEMFLGELESQCPNGTVTQAGCPVEALVTPIMMGMYILFTNILMFNLLIAMFSYTVERIQENIDLHWYFQRYFLIYEYYERPAIAPPLIIISHVYLLIKYMMVKCCRCCRKDKIRGFKMRFNENEEKQLILWENLNADEYLRRVQILEKESIENRVRETRERMELLSQRFENISTKEHCQPIPHGAAVGAVVQAPEAPPASRTIMKKLQKLEDNVSEVSKAIEWIIEALSENQLGAKSLPPSLPDIKRQKLEEKAQEEAKVQAIKKTVEEQIDLQIKLHVRSRTSPYPSSVPPVRRYELPDNKVSWAEAFPEYAPPNFTHPNVLRKPEWADVDLSAYHVESRPTLMYNEYDQTCSVSRISFEGPYQVKDGIPLNPMGRTGLTGRGLLGRWGPNFAADPIITRWKRDVHNNPITIEGKKVLEFVTVERKDIHQWALPGAITNKTRMDQVYDCVRAEFTEEALGSLMKDKKKQESIRARLDQLFKTGTVVYKGYADDPRNTDNAWLETIAVNYHDDDGTILTPFTLRAGNSVEAAAWQTATSSEFLYGGHLAYVKRAATLRNAYF